MDYPSVCPHCKANVSSTDFFCSSCGKKLKDRPPSTTIIGQILVYLLSALLPPLGIWPAIKYLRQEDEKSKRIGLTAIFLTIISILVTLWLSACFVNSLQKQLGTKLNQYQDLGY